MATLTESDIPNLSAKEISQTAAQFLGKFNPGAVLPVPIEDIVEKMGINILSVPNLERSQGINGSIDINSSTLLIDDYIYQHQIGRSRFTIAHEIGHVLLHKEIYNKNEIKDTNSYIDFRNSISGKLLSILEKQADKFAGEVLLPTEQFAEQLNKEVHFRGGEERLTMSDIGDIVKILEKRFGVDKKGILIKIQKDHPNILNNLL